MTFLKIPTFARNLKIVPSVGKNRSLCLNTYNVYIRAVDRRSKIGYNIIFFIIKVIFPWRSSSSTKRAKEIKLGDIYGDELHQADDIVYVSGSGS